MADAVDIKTYSDEPFYGKPAPSLEMVQFIRGDKFTFEAGKIYCLYFFNTFYKGMWWCNEEFTKLKEKYSDITWIAVSEDAELASAERFLGKVADGKILDENTKEPLRLTLDFTVWDEGKVMGKAYATAFDHTVLHMPQVVIVDGKSNMVWRQSFTQSFIPSESNFEDQLNKVVKGEELDQSNGAKPKQMANADEGSDCEVEGDMALF
jgi:hypothetical protein